MSSWGRSNGWKKRADRAGPDNCRPAQPLGYHLRRHSGRVHRNSLVWSIVHLSKSQNDVRKAMRNQRMNTVSATITNWP